MLKKTIKFEDYNGKERTEDFYFNLNKAELTELEASEAGGMAKRMMKIAKLEDFGELVKVFKEIILLSYGEKSPDGRRFIKNDEIRESFVQTEAFSVLFMELAQDAEAASAFVNGILPKDLPKDLPKTKPE